MQLKILRNIGSATVREFKILHDLDIEQWSEGQVVDVDEKAAVELLKVGLAAEIESAKSIEAVPATAGDVHGEADHEKHKGKHK